MCVSRKNTVIDDSNFVPNRLLMIHPTRAVTLRPKESKLTISIIRLKIFALKHSRGMICGSILTNLRMLKSKSLDEIMIRFCKFYPAVRHTLLMTLTSPSTTSTAVGSFSTLSRVKTWFRTTSGEDRIRGPYMISVHRNKGREKMQEITKS